MPSRSICRERLDVAAGGVDAVAAADHHHPHVRVLAERLDDGRDLAAAAIGDDVERRPVEMKPADPLLRHPPRSAGRPGRAGRRRALPHSPLHDVMSFRSGLTGKHDGSLARDLRPVRVAAAPQARRFAGKAISPLRLWGLTAAIGINAKQSPPLSPPDRGQSRGLTGLRRAAANNEETHMQFGDLRGWIAHLRRRASFTRSTPRWIGTASSAP